jgi:clan AA aspartic protease (TIGR02281 family)
MSNRLIRLCLIFLISLPSIRVAGETIQMQRQGGTYTVPVQINDAVTLPFVLDTGATSVAIPFDVFLTLLRTGTIKKRDFIGTSKYLLADGSEQRSDEFLLHKMTVGNHTIRDVVANVVPMKGDPLLGQSFLEKLPAWTVDNQRHALVLSDRQQSVAAIAPQLTQPTTDPLQTYAPPFPQEPARAIPSETGQSVADLRQRANQALATKNYGDVMKWCRPAAEAGDAFCLNALGALYAKGLGGAPQDYGEATQWYRKAADQGMPLAQHNLASMYFYGCGVQQNYAEAARWYRKAADQAMPAAQFRLGYLYQEGLGISRDTAEAMRWYILSANNGYSDAANQLGTLHEKAGAYADALRWYELAASRGSGLAKKNLGQLYLFGRGVARDYNEAMRWYHQAADKGIPEAMNDIGYMAANGLGVGKDCIVAKAWFERAAAAGEPTARENLATGAVGACSW